MTEDIVTRLRVLSHHAKKLAENESLHDLHFDALTRCEDLTWLAADEIQRLRKERDEARREILESLHPDLRKSYADARGWDCLKEATDDRQ